MVIHINFKLLNNNGLIINVSSSDNNISKLEINTLVNLKINNEKIITLEK